MHRDATSVLGAILKDGVDVHRCAAARALGQLPDTRTTGLLTEALLDEDPDVRADAAEALRGLEDPETAGALMQNLIGDPEPDVKKPALAALIAMRHPDVLPLLRKLAVSRTNEIAWDEDEFYTDEWDSWIDLQAMAIEGLGAFADEEGVEPVLTAMGDELGQDVMVAGINALSRMGASGLATLTDLFDGGTDQMRRRIAEAVAAGSVPKEASLLDAMLADPSQRVRMAGVVALDPSDARLESAFEDDAAQVRAAALAHAGATHPDKTAAMAGDADPEVRVEVFRVVAENPDLFTDEEFAETVQKSISGEPKAAIAAATALLALRGEGVVKGLTHAMTKDSLPLEFRLGAIEVLKKAGPSSVPHLLTAAGDVERQIRLAALTAVVGFAADDPVWPNPAGEGLLAALNGELVLPPEEPEEEKTEAEDLPLEAEETESEYETPLVAVEDDDPSATNSTLDAILSPKLPDADPSEEEAKPIELSEHQQKLLKMAQTNRMAKRKMAPQVEVAPHLDVRRFSAALLGGVPNSQVTERLLAVLTEEDGELRDAALASLVQHGETIGQLPVTAFEVFEELLSEDTSETRVLALRALAYLPGEASANLMAEHLADTDPLVRVEAVRGRGLLGVDDKMTDACLSDPYVGVGLAAVQIIAEKRGVDAVEPLISFGGRHDGTYRREVGRLLGAHTGQPGIDRLIELLGDDSRQRERLVQIEALVEAEFAKNTQDTRKIA